MAPIQPEPDERVRKASAEEANQEIDRQTLQQIRQYGYRPPKAVSDRLKELDDEWDMEKMLEVNAASFALGGLLLGTFFNKRWYLLPGVVATFLLQHGLQGWCPPMPLFRALGYRSRHEIEEERYALKALRGDFRQVSSDSSPEEVLRVIRQK